VIAEQQEVGPCLEGVLGAHGYRVTSENSYATDGTGGRTFDVIIATNTSLTPVQIRKMIPIIRARNPDARIIVLSGYCREEWVTDLRQTGIDGFLELPFEEGALLSEVSALLSKSHP
jgi:DNA-binding NarL/FixJ family response regulator